MSFFGVMLALFCLEGCVYVVSRDPVVKNGRADLTSTDFSAGIVDLAGDWLLFPDEILSPEEVERGVDGAGEFARVKVPGIWQSQEFNGKKGSIYGIGTMALTISLPPESPPLSIRMALSQGSSRVFLNGVTVDADLVTDPHRPDLVPPGNPRYYSVPAGTESIRIVIQKVNWWDGYGSGMITAPRIGLTRDMEEIRNFNIGYESFLIGCFVFCALYHLMLFFLEKRDRALLLFALISLSVLLRQISIGEKFLMSMMGVGHFTLLRFEHGSAYLVCVLFILYFSLLYPRVSPRLMRWILVALGSFGIVATMLPDLRIFSGMMFFLHGVIILSAAFCLYVSIKAILARQEHSRAMFVGIIFLAVPTCLDILVTYFFVIVRYVMPLGFLPFILIETYILARRYAQGTREAEVLRIKTDRLAELDRAKTAFIANVSHELRTPITLIKTPIEAMRAGVYGESIPRGHRLFSVIGHNADRLLRLVENFLMMTRLESGSALETVPVDLASVLPRYIEDVMPIADMSGIKVALKIDSVADAVQVVADIDIRAFDIIFFNLVVNAIKFSNPGGTVTVLLRGGADKSRKVILLSVTDTGIGISPDALASLFSRYGKVYDSERSNYDGNGIGLSLARETARALGGDISVTSEVGKGSCFTLTLPESSSGIACHQNIELSGYAKLLGSMLPPVSSASEAPVSSRTNVNGSSRTRLLVVEDNDEMRRFIAESLASEYEIIEAVDGEDARDKLEKGDLPDLVICDVMMPRMDGFSLFRYTRSKPLLSSLMFIMLTARDESDEKVRMLREGVFDYIVKPFRVDELRARISTVIQHRDQERSSFRKRAEKIIEGLFSEQDKGVCENTEFEQRLLSLSSRECEVMELASRGMPDKQIAETLGISIRTASNHIASILRKTGLSGRRDLMKCAKKTHTDPV